MDVIGSARIKASLFHLFASLCVFSVAFLVVYWVWFPHALFEASGGFDGLKIVAYVDLILGPLLTLIVFNTTKSRRHLIKDISIIAGLQVACLIAGLWAVYQARPLVVVHVYDSFYVMNRADMEAISLDVQQLNSIAGDYPKIVYVPSEKSLPAFRTKQMLDRLNRKPEFQWRIGEYRPWSFEAVALHDDEVTAEGCVLRNIQSAYRAGVVCIDPSNLRFSQFEAGESISLLGILPR